MSKPSRHSPPSGNSSRRRQSLLYDPNIPTPSHAEYARTLMAQAADATLSTLAVEPAGHPYGSLVLFGELDGDPILLISTLAEHTKNLLVDRRCSLLVTAAGPQNPLALGRVTLVATAEPVDTDTLPQAREAFLSKNPDAKGYADFRDFQFWRLRVQGIRYIGGFGRMSWVPPQDWQAATPDPIAPHAAPIIEHMNDDHTDAMVLYCKAFSSAGEVSAATMTGVDRYGFEMRAETADGPRPIRVAFEKAAVKPGQIRTKLVQLVRRARAELADVGGVASEET